MIFEVYLGSVTAEKLPFITAEGFSVKFFGLGPPQSACAVITNFFRRLADSFFKCLYCSFSISLQPHGSRCCFVINIAILPYSIVVYPEVLTYNTTRPVYLKFQTCIM